MCLCLYVGIYRRLSANAQRLCGMKVCGGCWNLIERGFDSGSHLTPRSFTRVYVTLKMRRSFIQLHNDLKATESRSGGGLLTNFHSAVCHTHTFCIHAFQHTQQSVSV